MNYHFYFEAELIVRNTPGDASAFMNLSLRRDYVLGQSKAPSHF